MRPLESLLPQIEYEEGQDAAQLRMHVLASGSWRGRVRQTTRSGVVVDVESSVSVRRDDDGEYAGLVAVNRDITEMLAAQAAVQTQARFTQDVMDALEHRAAVIDADGHVRAVNARWRNGLTDRDHCVLGPVPLGHSWTDEVLASSGAEYAAFAAEVQAVLRGERPVARMECRCAAAGPDRATSIEVVQLAGKGSGAIVVQSDVSWRRRLQDELTHRATHDELTGLPNRAALREGLSAALSRLDGERQLAVLFCDLDGFKDVNDGFGHSVGDQVLVAVARRLRQRCRSADVVARFGGDEFVVVLTVPDPDRAVRMAERIVEALAEPLVVGDAEIASGVSIGITVVRTPPEGDDPVGALLRDADTAMYQAKERGRGPVRVLRRRAAQGHRQAGGALRGPAPGGHRRRAQPDLSGSAALRRPLGRRCGGAAAVAPPALRCRGPRDVHSDRGADRADRRGGPVGAAPGGCRVRQGRRPPADGRGERLAAPADRLEAARHRGRRPGGQRPGSLAARPRDHRGRPGGGPDERPDAC